MNNNIRIVSFNCKNVKTSVSCIKNLCNSHDVILLQETWLYKQELSFLNTIDYKFYAKGFSTIDYSKGPLVGRPYGGIAILWRKTLGKKCLITGVDDRIMAISLPLSNNENILLYNVYLPYQCRDNYGEFMEYIGKINMLVQSADTPYVLVMGDFNADLSNINDNSNNGVHFGKELRDFCHNEGLILSDYVKLGNNNDTHTFISSAHSSVSWLDHCISTTNGHLY